MLRIEYVPVILVLAVGMLCGCSGGESVRKDLTERRTESFRRWDDLREKKDSPQTVLKGELSIADSVRIALAGNKVLQSALREKEIAAGRVLEAYSAAYPRLTASGNYTRLDETPGFDVGGTTISIGEEDNYSAGLTLNQPLYRGGAIGAGIRAAAVYEVLSDEIVRGSVQETIFRVASAYFDGVLAEHLHAANEAAFKSADEHMDDIKRREQAGVASRFDVLRIEVELSSIRAEMIRQKNAVETSVANLLRVMGVSQESSVVLCDELAYRPMSPVLGEAVRMAYENRSDLRQAELGILLQKEALRYARSGYRPSVDLFFNEEWSRPDSSGSRDDWGDSWTAGITVQWSIFDGMGREGRVAQEKAVLAQKKVHLAAAEEAALLEIRSAVLNMENAEEFVESQSAGLEKAREAMELANIGYREGINSRIEASDARSAFIRATSLYYQAVHSHAMARLFYQKATGTLGPRASVRGEDVVRPVEMEDYVQEIPAEEEPEGDGE